MGEIIARRRAIAALLRLGRFPPRDATPMPDVGVQFAYDPRCRTRNGPLLCPEPMQQALAELDAIRDLLEPFG